MSNFIGKLFDTTADGGAAATAFIDAVVTGAGSPPQSYAYLVAALPYQQSNSSFLFVILSHADVTSEGNIIGTSATVVNKAIADDGGTSLIAAMNANFSSGGSPAEALIYVSSCQISTFLVGKNPFVTVVQNN